MMAGCISELTIQKVIEVPPNRKGTSANLGVDFNSVLNPSRGGGAFPYLTGNLYRKRRKKRGVLPWFRWKLPAVGWGREG